MTNDWYSDLVQNRYSINMDKQPIKDSEYWIDGISKIFWSKKYISKIIPTDSDLN